MKSNRNESLTPRQLQVLPHLLASPSYEEAAKRAGISVKQIFIWLRDPNFLKELRKHQGLIFAGSISTLKAATEKAVQTLINCLGDTDSRVRLSAAEKILNNAYKGMEMCELEERLQAVEQRIEESTSNET